MKNKVSELTIISYGLILLYATTFVIYLQYLDIPDFRPHAFVLLLLNIFLLVGAVGVNQYKDWGRKWMVFGNIMAGLYLLMLYLNFSDFIPMSYVFMSVVVALFFSQSHIRNRFSLNLKTAWKSILVVDDDEGIVKTVRPILMTNGYSVLTALTGEEGLQIAFVQKPDLIILDVILPGMKGREVCRKLKADSRTRNIPVVFLTSKDSPDDVRAEKEAGAVAHLTKPINPKELIATINNAIT